MSETLGPSPQEMGVKPNLIEKDAPKTEAEAAKNQEYFQAMNQLFMAERDGKNVQELLASNQELAKSVKEVLDNKQYNPEGLTLEQIQGQFARESTSGEKGTDNKWKNMVTLADGRAVANPFAVAAGLGRSIEKGMDNVDSGKKPDVKSVTETGETGDADKAREEADKIKKDRETRAKADGETAKTAVDQILTTWLKEGEENGPGIPAAPEGNMHAAEMHKGGSENTSRTEGTPFGTREEIRRRGEAMRAEGGQDLAPVSPEAPAPSIADRIRGGLKKLFGGGESAPMTATTETPAISAADQQKLVDAWMANNPDQVPDQNLSAGGAQEGFNRPTRRVTETGPSSTTSYNTELPGSVDAGALGRAMKESNAREAAQNEQEPPAQKAA